MTTTTRTTKTTRIRTAARRVIAASAVVAGIGAAVVVPSTSPASAHETHHQLGASTAAVGANHGGIRICARDRGYVAQVRWYSPGQTTEKRFGVIWGACDSYVDPDGVARWRLCLAPGGGCTPWKAA